MATDLGAIRKGMCDELDRMSFTCPRTELLQAKIDLASAALLAFDRAYPEVRLGLCDTLFTKKKRRKG
jgi:hypothetical protein